MIFITFSSLWSFTFFFLTSYIILLISVLVYLLPILGKTLFFSNVQVRSHFRFIGTFDFFWISVTPVILILLLAWVWVSPTFTVWFGQLVVGSFQLKLLYFLLFNFFIYLVVFNSTHYFTSTEVFDYVIVLYHLFYWVYFLFLANSVFTVIFIIEVINVLVFLLVTSTTFSSTFFYKSLGLNYSHNLTLNTPHTYIQALLYLFWISLVSSLGIFLFLIFFYFTTLTFDWVLVEYVFLYITSVSSLKDILVFGVVWLVLLISLFLKCGVAPVYFWKPTFFRGLPLTALFFYITFIYFNFLLFITHFITLHLGEVFYYYVFIFWFLLVISLVTLLLILIESYYIKVFLALSSILNSLLVFLLVTGVHTSSLLFIF